MAKDLADYCVIGSTPEHRLSQFERLTLVGGAELERALGWIAKQLANFSHPQVPCIDPAEIKSAAEFYRRGPWVSDPKTFFADPVQQPQISENLVHGLSDGAVVDLNFTSVYEPWNKDCHVEPTAMEANNQVHVRHWRHEAGQAPTIIAIHGWTMGDQRLNSLAFLPGHFYQLGFDVALIELPFHGRRRDPKNQIAGKFVFPSVDLILTNEAMGQIISDLRVLRNCLRSRGSKAVGCIGMSLGAYVGALWAGLDELDFCIPMVPMVSMAEVAWEMLSREAQFGDLKAAGIDRALLEEVYSVHCPLNYPLKTSRERALILAGIGDRIIPPRQPKLLWDHWRRPEMVWLRGGHVAQFTRTKAYEDIRKFFRRLELI